MSFLKRLGFKSQTPIIYNLTFNVNKMLLNCIIVDDEPLARKGIKEYIGDVEFLCFDAEYDNPMKAMEALSRQHNIHLLFLDIQMPKLTGLELVKTIQHAPPVIFTTAYPQYALDGFELNALDYLVKPVSFERFLKAAMKAKEYYEVRQKNSTLPEATNAAEYFFIKCDNKLVKIFFQDILFVEALQNYVSIQTTDKKYISYLTFKSIEEYLPETRFIKTHKSFIVSAGKIESIEGNNIKVGQHDIPISRTMKDEVIVKLVNGKYLKR